MQGNKHQKHVAISKPTGGRFHRNEWTVIGAPCQLLDMFVGQLSQRLSSENISTGYLDMSHRSEDMEEKSASRLEDKIDHWVLRTKAALHERDYRKYFNQLDLLFVNGNHYKADQQIVFVTEKKKESLQRKLDRLSNVRMFLLDNDQQGIHAYLEEFRSKNTPVFRLNEIDKIVSFILERHQSQIPPIKGLVLNGGKSQRMGFSKGEINYHGKSQKEVEAELLAEFCSQTYYSVSGPSTDQEGSDYDTIIDSFTGLGPYGGILSAFREDPNSAWLSLACDLPYLDKDVIRQLVERRNPSKLATCFYNPETNFPEPLITIWEPRAYPILLDFLSQGYSCPRKVLINSDIEMIEMDEPLKMRNANTPDEKSEAESFIKQSQK